YTTHVCSGGMPVSLTARATAWPERFMYVWGRTNQTPRSSDRPTSDCHRLRSMDVPMRRASSRTHVKPRLWRVSAYSDSGLPSPTINVSSLFSMQAQLGPRRAPQTCTWSVPRQVTLQREVGEPPHLPPFGGRAVVPPQQMQEPVDQQDRQLDPLGMGLLPRLRHDRPPRAGAVAHAPP